MKFYAKMNNVYMSSNGFSIDFDLQHMGADFWEFYELVKNKHIIEVTMEKGLELKMDKGQV